MPPKRSVCGTPIFRDMLEVEKQLLIEKGSKAADTYGKAIKSMNNNPIPFAHPAELAGLAFVGPKIIALLTKKYRVYCDENNIDMPDTPQKAKVKAKAAGRPAASRPAAATKRKPTGRARATVEDDDEEDEDEDPASPAPKPKRKAPAPVTYVPKPRSGAYGILMGLVLAVDEPKKCTQVFLTKGELIRLAQPYCDMSYEIAERGILYTAWAGMNTLIVKEYIYKNGNPHKYCLTEEGYRVARQIQSQHENFEGMNLDDFPWIDEMGPALAVALTASNRPRPTGPNIPLNLNRPAPTQSLTEKSRLLREQTEARRSSAPGRFQFWYIASDGSKVSSMSEAASRLDPEEYTSIRKIEFKKSQSTHPFAKQLKLVTANPNGRATSGEDTCFGYTAEDGAPPTCSKFEETARDLPRDIGSGGAGSKRRRSHSPNSEIDLDEDDDETTPRAMPKRPPPKRTPDQLFSDIGGSTFARTHSAPVKTTSTGPRTTSQLAADAAARRSGLSATATVSMSSLPGPSVTREARPAPRMSSHAQAPNPLVDDDEDEEVSVKLPNFNPSTAITFPAGSYDIVCIVDTREVESTKSRDKISQELEDRGVKVETRALKLGDFLWIARKRDGHGGSEDECVLDYVVERKRLDDLCSSIRDDRYEEQKYRLTNSMIRHVYYIIEQFQPKARTPTEVTAIMTAKSQLQVHNRFFMKETTALRETIDFIKTMTDIIISSHRNIDLHIIPEKHISQTSYIALQKKLRTPPPSIDGDMDDMGEISQKSFLISFESYQALNDKNGGKTLKEKWANMLLTTNGMSQEKLSVILEVWQTPIALWRDLKRHEIDWASKEGNDDDGDTVGAEGKKKVGKKKIRGKEMFFADKTFGDGRRKVNDALSKKLYNNLMGGEDD